MNLPAVRRRRPPSIPSTPEEMTPRRAAVELLAEKIAAGAAGLDCYDHRSFIVELSPNEVKWGTIAVALCGWPVDRHERPDGSVRLYAVVEADVRAELGLDAPEPPVLVEPLASRNVGAVLVDATLSSLPGSYLQITPGEPIAMAAIRAAKTAYDGRYPNGVH